MAIKAQISCTSNTRIRNGAVSNELTAPSIVSSPFIKENVTSKDNEYDLDNGKSTRETQNHRSSVLTPREEVFSVKSDVTLLKSMMSLLCAKLGVGLRSIKMVEDSAFEFRARNLKPESNGTLFSNILSEMYTLRTHQNQPGPNVGNPT